VSTRFLVVEDDTAFADNLSELLELSGFSSQRAGTAAEARTLASSQTFDAALVDLGLPDGRGTDLVAELKLQLPHLMAIVLTGQPTIGSAQNAIRAGATAYLMKDGDPRELEAVIRRTAEQASLGRALRESEKRYALLVERAPLGIALVREGRFTFANERFATIFGVPDAQRLVGLPIENVYHPEERARVRDSWRLDHEPWEETYARSGIRRVDGKTVDIMVTRSRLEIDGRTAFQLVVRDTTDEKRLGRELDEARGQLEDKRRLAAIGEMVAGIAHEIRNPLQGVLWGINELRTLCTDKSEVVQEALGKIERGSGDIEAIVAEVLDYARPMKPDLISFPVLDLLEAVREDASVHARGAGVAIEVDPTGASFEAVFDALKIKQALVNLVRNAIEASPGGSRVVIGAKRTGERLTFDVADEGSGVSPAIRERIFVPFVTTKVKGTGLGLAVVRRIVEAHGGTIRLDPREPRGTRARIDLPLR
jgi:PAS domain S-box-containing protein